MFVITSKLEDENQKSRPTINYRTIQCTKNQHTDKQIV